MIKNEKIYLNLRYTNKNYMSISADGNTEVKLFASKFPMLIKLMMKPLRFKFSDSISLPGIFIQYYNILPANFSTVTQIRSNQPKENLSQTFMGWIRLNQQCPNIKAPHSEQTYHTNAKLNKKLFMMHGSMSSQKQNPNTSSQQQQQ